MSASQTKQLSVNVPGWTSFWCVLGLYFFGGQLWGELNEWETDWRKVVFFVIVMFLIGIYITRFWLTPSVRFDEEGIHIDGVRSSATVVPFKNITELSVSDTLNVFSKYIQADLYYTDADGAKQRVRFMLHYSRQFFDRQLPLHEFLKRVKEANKDFVFEHARFWGPHH